MRKKRPCHSGPPGDHEDAEYANSSKAFSNSSPKKKAFAKNIANAAVLHTSLCWLFFCKSPQIKKILVRCQALAEKPQNVRAVRTPPGRGFTNLADSRGADFAGAQANRLFNPEDEDFSVSDIAG